MSSKRLKAIHLYEHICHFRLWSCRFTYPCPRVTSWPTISIFLASPACPLSLAAAPNRKSSCMAQQRAAPENPWPQGHVFPGWRLLHGKLWWTCPVLVLLEWLPRSLSFLTLQGFRVRKRRSMPTLNSHTAWGNILCKYPHIRSSRSSSCISQWVNATSRATQRCRNSLVIFFPLNLSSSELLLETLRPFCGLVQKNT